MRFPIFLTGLRGRARNDERQQFTGKIRTHRNSPCSSVRSLRIGYLKYLIWWVESLIYILQLAQCNEILIAYLNLVSWLSHKFFLYKKLSLPNQILIMTSFSLVLPISTNVKLLTHHNVRTYRLIITWPNFRRSTTSSYVKLSGLPSGGCF